MSEELKPCKTCGNENFELARTQVWIDQGLEELGPYCHCLACGSMFLAESKDWGDQVKAWNIRHEDKRVAELEMQNAMLKKGMDLVNAELADLKDSVRHLISDAHISGFVLEGGGERSIMYFVKGEFIDDLKRSLIQDDDK